MALITPTQTRTLDPYTEERWSSNINRLTRIATAGENMIIHGETSFKITIVDDSNITVHPGLFVKDDCLIHITQDYNIDFSDSTSNLYIDTTQGMDVAGYYFVVIQYNYARVLPPKQAFYRLIKDKTLYDTYGTDSLVYLANIRVVDDGGYKIDTSVQPYYYHPSYPTTILRNTGGNPFNFDGGEIS